MKPNSQQQAVIDEYHTPCLVIAGAGSGKTATICQKIHSLIKKNLASKILALTFTNKAAREMQNRLKESNISSSKAKIMTFHRLGLFILQKFHKDLGLRSSFTLIDHKDKLSILEQLAPSTDPLIIEKAAYTFSTLKQHPNPSDLLNLIPEEIRPLWGEYQNMLIRLNCVDLDDLVFLAFQILNQPHRRESMSEEIDYLFIDEYQDTNLIQYELFRLLEPNGHFTLVGDDDQSIYTWRGANPENLFLVRKDYPSLNVLKMEENFRCNPDILEAANKLIRNNTHLFPKTLWSRILKEPSVWLIPAVGTEEEAHKIAEDLRLRLKSDESYGILFRTNYQSLELEKALRERQLGYKILGGSSLFQKSVIVDFMSYLRLILNEDDDLAFKRIINIPRRNIGPKKLAALIEHSEKHEVTLLKGCNEFRFLHHWDQKTAMDFSSFHKMIVAFQKRFRHEKTLKWIDDLIAEIDYYGWIEQNTTHAKTAQQQIQWVKDFVRWIYASHKKTQDLEEILRKILLMDKLEQKSQHETNITLATIHAVKGLEFDEVYIFGCNEGLLPHKESGESIEEERRLMYVAMTRAKKRLVLSHSFGEGESTGLGKSRFLDEIGKEYLRPIGGDGPASWEEMRHLLGL